MKKLKKNINFLLFAVLINFINFTSCINYKEASEVAIDVANTILSSKILMSSMLYLLGNQIVPLILKKTHNIPDRNIKLLRKTKDQCKREDLRGGLLRYDEHLDKVVDRNDPSHYIYSKYNIRKELSSLFFETKLMLPALYLILKGYKYYIFDPTLNK